MEEEMKTEIVPEQVAEPVVIQPESPNGKKPGVFDKKEIRIGVAALGVLIIVIIAWMLLQPKFIAARVNGGMISRMDVVRELERQGGLQVLDNLISERLILQKAASENVVVSAADIDAEIGNLTSQLEVQNQTLDDYLTSQGLTRKVLTERINLRLTLDKLLADRIGVTDEEIDAFIAENSAYFPEGTDTSDADFRTQIRDSVEQQKFDAAASDYLDELRSSANIQYVHQY